MRVLTWCCGARSVRDVGGGSEYVGAKDVGSEGLEPSMLELELWVLMLIPC